MLPGTALSFTAELSGRRWVWLIAVQDSAESSWAYSRAALSAVQDDMTTVRDSDELRWALPETSESKLNVVRDSAESQKIKKADSALFGQSWIT